MLGALTEFQDILGAALRIQKMILGIRNSRNGTSLLEQWKATVLEATLGVIPHIDGNPHERFHVRLHSQSFFLRIWGAPARQK